MILDNYCYYSESFFIIKKKCFILNKQFTIRIITSTAVLPQLFVISLSKWKSVEKNNERDHRKLFGFMHSIFHPHWTISSKSANEGSSET